MAPYSGQRPPADAVHLRFAIDEGGSHTVTVDPYRGLLFLSRPMWDGDVWTETLSSPLQAGDRVLLDRTQAEFGGVTPEHLAVADPKRVRDSVGSEVAGNAGEICVIATEAARSWLGCKRVKTMSRGQRRRRMKVPERKPPRRTQDTR